MAGGQGYLLGVLHMGNSSCLSVCLSGLCECVLMYVCVCMHPRVSLLFLWL